MKKLAIALMATGLLGMVGCASTGTEYYEAIRKTAEANALASAAKYEALSKIASSGDQGAASAAVMAIALTQDKSVVPQYVESDALKWASVLVPGATTLGSIWLQTDLAKAQSNNSKEIQMASFASNQAIQLGQQDMIVGLGSQWSTASTASADLAIAGFNALNTAGQQTVDLGIAGLGTADSIAGAGFDATTNVAGLGFATVDSVATTGFQTSQNISTAGMTGIVDVSKWGMEGIWLTAQNGMNGMEALGTAGMTGMVDISTGYNTLLDSIQTTNAATLTTTLGDANATNLSGQSNYATIIANLQATINQISADLATPITCQDDGTGTIVCN
jgi:hypothetical protein